MSESAASRTQRTSACVLLSTSEQSNCATCPAGLLALIGWIDHYRSALVGLGLPDDAIAIDTAPRVRTPRGDAVPLHGIDVARLVYIARIRKQLASAFKNLAEGDLLKVCVCGLFCSCLFSVLMPPVCSAA